MPAHNIDMTLLIPVLSLVLLFDSRGKSAPTQVFSTDAAVSVSLTADTVEEKLAKTPPL